MIIFEIHVIFFLSVSFILPSIRSLWIYEFEEIRFSTKEIDVVSFLSYLQFCEESSGTSLL